MAEPVTPEVTAKDNFYRWSNLREIVKVSSGERVTSLDVSDLPEFYFSPFSSTKQVGGGKSWLDNTYLRVVLAKDKLVSAGWTKDPALKGEGAWRYKGRKSETELAKEYTSAIKRVEVDDIPVGKTLEDVSAIVEFRLGRKVPIVESTSFKIAGEPAIPKAELGQSIAKELGVRYDGVQEGIGMQFTDPKTGSTTYGNTLEEVKTNLAEMRVKFLKGGNPVAKTEAERKSLHERIFGKGSTPPTERLGKGETLNNLLPMPPEEGPPLPRMLALRWPWKK